VIGDSGVGELMALVRHIICFAVSLCTLYVSAKRTSVIMSVVFRSYRKSIMSGSVILSFTV
jgi:hypothetical protein